jgi:hypothetical protein
MSPILMGRRAFTNALCGIPLCVRRSSVAPTPRKALAKIYPTEIKFHGILASSKQRNRECLLDVVTSIEVENISDVAILIRSNIGRPLLTDLWKANQHVGPLRTRNDVVYWSASNVHLWLFSSKFPVRITVGWNFKCLFFKNCTKVRWNYRIVSTSALHDCIWQRNPFPYYTFYMYMYDVAYLHNTWISVLWL